MIKLIACLLVLTVSFAKLSQSAVLPKDEQMALTRDGMSRDHPDELLGGFFAAWPAVLWILSAFFLVLAVVAFLGYAVGLCKTPRDRRFQPVIN